MRTAINTLAAAIIALGLLPASLAAQDNGEPEQSAPAASFQLAQTASMQLDEVTDYNYWDKVSRTDEPYVLFVAAHWCGPCAASRQMLQELAAEYRGRVIIGELDAEMYPSLVRSLGARQLPTVIVFYNGAARDRSIGSIGKDGYRRRIEAAIESMSR